MQTHDEMLNELLDSLEELMTNENAGDNEQYFLSEMKEYILNNMVDAIHNIDTINKHLSQIELVLTGAELSKETLKRAAIIFGKAYVTTAKKYSTIGLEANVRSMKLVLS